MEYGTYQGETGWTGWFGAEGWITFYRPGQVATYARESDGAVKGDPAVLNY